MSPPPSPAPADAIAIIGMACRFPEAPDIESYWRLLRDGVEAVRFPDPDALRAAGDTPERMRHPRYVASPGAVLDDVDAFDAAFFGIEADRAALMDPQHRVFLECTHAALEDAGYDPTRYPGMIALFAGAGRNHYLLEHLLPQARAMATAGPLEVTLTNDKDFVPLRVSYLLDLRGPSVGVQTACSTSLVATHLACQSLLSGDADIALAGGVSITTLHGRGYIGSDDGLFSADGHCRPFDADATGPAAGNGAGVVVLKRLEDALRDRDCVRALILGSAINNDGATKVGFTAPAVEGQRQVVRDALSIAGVDAGTISYVEAHGTGTKLGDMIEVAALTDAFRDQTVQRAYCGIGSVKSNFGHTNTAAGVAGLIKVVLALQNRELPASLNFARPNPEIDFADSPFRVVDRRQRWAADTPRRAAVHAVAMGGTNAHAVLQEAPAAHPRQATETAAHVLPLSAPTAEGLQRVAERLRSHLQAHPDQALADIAYTLQVGRRAFDHRLAVVATTTQAAVAALEDFASPAVATPGRALTLCLADSAPEPEAWRRLQREDNAFRDAISECGDPEALLAENGGRSAFAWLYALAKSWQRFGVTPARTVGSGIAEWVAKSLDGRCDLSTGLAHADRITPTGAVQPPDDPTATRLVIGAASSEADATGGLLDPLPVIARLWCEGIEIDWQPRADLLEARRVSLPTYPFARARHWIDAGDGTPATVQPEAEVDGWLYVPTWNRVPVPTERVTVRDTEWLVLADPTGVGDHVAARLRHRGAGVTCITPAAAFEQVGDRRYALRPDSKDDWQRLFEQLAAQGRQPQHALHLWSLAPASENGAANPHLDSRVSLCVDSLRHIVEHVDASAGNGAVMLVTDRLSDVLGGEVADPERALAVGAFRALTSEHRRLRARHLDLCLAPPQADAAAAADIVIDEATTSAPNSTVAYRGLSRWRQSHTRLRASAVASTNELRGTVLITGGFGRVGQSAALQLAAPGVHLLLTTRRPMAAPDTDERGASIAALQALGATVEVAVLDPADGAALRHTVERSRADNGPLRGAIGAATPRLHSPDAIRCGVECSRALLAAVAGEPVQFTVLTTCITSVLGGDGVVTDAAAATAAESIALAADADARARVVTWDRWDDHDGILGDDGRTALGRILTSPERHVIVSRYDLDARRAGATPRAPARSGSATAPRTPLERDILAIWSECLQDDSIGVLDNFFEVGGRSATATRVLALLRERLSVELPLRQLFEAPTVADLAAVIESRQSDDAGRDDSEREEIEI